MTKHAVVLLVLLCPLIVPGLVSVLDATAGVSYEATPSTIVTTSHLTPDEPSRVTIDAGTVEGMIDSSGVHIFRGIPYSAPPVGELRWRPPQPVEQWDGIHQAKEYGASCPQPQRRGAGAVTEPTSEDCLFLNVYTTSTAEGGEAAPARPVMVWFHGGGFVGGSARGYDGHALARKGIVVVTLNYRVGPFGYLAHPALADASSSGSAGNYGMLDQIAALEWVQRNIAQFGGDPTRVTIFGESAGGFSVGALLASPRARGLFHRAILQSGTGLSFGILSADSARAFALAGAAGIGVQGTDAHAAAELRALPKERILEAYPPAYSLLMPHRIWFGPVVDGPVLPRPLDQAIANGSWNAVPVIVGSNADEGPYFVRWICTGGVVAPAAPCFPPDAADGASMREAFRTLLGPEGYGDSTGVLERAYPIADSSEMQDQAYCLVGDVGFGAPARALARLVTNVGARAYLYHFTREAIDATGQRIEALHTTELPFVFGLLPEVWSPYSAYQGRAPYDARLADAMSDYWVAFAAAGDPNAAPAAGKWPQWPVYEPKDDTYFELGAEMVAKKGLRRLQYDAVDRVARSRGEIRP